MDRSSHHKASVVLLILVGLIALGATPRVAAAEPIVVGGYTLAAHWRVEPAQVQQSNAIVLVFAAEDQTAVSPDLTGLAFSVRQGDTRAALVVSVDEQGNYSAPYKPAQVGSAVLEITGMIDGVEVTETLDLPDVVAVTVALPAIGVDTPASFENTEAPGPNWVMIGGIVLAVVMLAAAVLLGRTKA